MLENFNATKNGQKNFHLQLVKIKRIKIEIDKFEK